MGPFRDVLGRAHSGERSNRAFIRVKKRSGPEMVLSGVSWLGLCGLWGNGDSAAWIVFIVYNVLQ